MPFKPMPEKEYRRYLKLVGWTLEKGGIDWHLYDDKGSFICVIALAHGKAQKKVLKPTV